MSVWDRLFDPSTTTDMRTRNGKCISEGVGKSK